MGRINWKKVARVLSLSPDPSTIKLTGERLEEILEKPGLTTKDWSSQKEALDHYYQRFMRLRTLILSDAEMLSNIDSLFKHVYLDENLSDDVFEKVTYLGEGKKKIVYNIGSKVDSENGRVVPIAVKLLFRSLKKPYHLVDYGKFVFAEDLSSFPIEFYRGKVFVPYFTGMVSWAGTEKWKGLTIPAFITEDVSNCGEFELEEHQREYFIRTTHDGIKRKYLLDPRFGRSSASDSRYLDEGVIIPVN